MLTMQPELDQAHRITSLVVVRGSQVHDRIEHSISLITDVRHLITHLMGVPTNPPDSSGGKLVKESEAEIAAIKKQQRTCLHAFHQGQNMRLAVIARIRPTIHAHELVADAHQTRH